MARRLAERIGATPPALRMADVLAEPAGEPSPGGGHRPLPRRVAAVSAAGGTVDVDASALGRVLLAEGVAHHGLEVLAPGS